MIATSVKIRVIASAAAFAFTTACQPFDPTKQDVGMPTGAILGGVFGAQIGHGSGRAVATIGGAALGGRRETVYGTACRQADGSGKAL